MPQPRRIASLVWLKTPCVTDVVCGYSRRGGRSTDEHRGRSCALFPSAPSRLWSRSPWSRAPRPRRRRRSVARPHGTRSRRATRRATSGSHATSASRSAVPRSRSRQRFGRSARHQRRRVVHDQPVPRGGVGVGEASPGATRVLHEHRQPGTGASEALAARPDVAPGVLGRRSELDRLFVRLRMERRRGRRSASRPTRRDACITSTWKRHVVAPPTSTGGSTSRR